MEGPVCRRWVEETATETQRGCQRRGGENRGVYDVRGIQARAMIDWKLSGKMRTKPRSLGLVTWKPNETFQK